MSSAPWGWHRGRLVPPLCRSYISERLAGTSCHQGHLPRSEPGGRSGVGQEPRSPSDGDAGGVRLPAIELAASQPKGFGVTPSRAPLTAWYPPLRTHRDAWLGLIIMLRLVPSQLVQCGRGGRGQPQAVTPLVPKVVSRAFFEGEICAAAYNS